MAEFDPLNPLEHITPRFTEEQLTELGEWFDENSKPLLIINQDAEPTNAITVDQLRGFFGLHKIHRRSLYTPTYDEIMKEIENIKMAAFKMVTKDQFIYLLDNWMQEPDLKHELKLAFKVFDTEERSFLEIDTLRELLTTLGEEPFTNEEIIEFLRDANYDGDGNIKYSDFVESMFKLAPELYNLPKEYLFDDPDEDPSVPPLPPPPPEPEPVIEPVPGEPSEPPAGTTGAKGAAGAKDAKGAAGAKDAKGAKGADKKKK